METNVASVLKKVSSSTPTELPNFWEFAYIHLPNNERERFSSSLRHVWSDRGRTRSLIRATLNEHSLERYILTWLADPNLHKSYESWALMRDSESTPLLLSTAKALNTIIFALSIDNSDLNVVRVVKEVTRSEPIIAAPSPPLPLANSSVSSKKKTRQIFMDEEDDDDGTASTCPGKIKPQLTDENLSSLCLIKTEELQQSPIKPSTPPSQVFNVHEELPSEIQSIVYRSAPPSMTSSRMSTSITSERLDRLELFPEPPSSNIFVFPQEDLAVGDTDIHEDEAERDKRRNQVSSLVPSEDEESVHSSAVSSVDVDTEKLRSRLRDTEDRCQYLEARVAELSLENHRLKGMTNSPRGGLNYFTVSVPRVHLENNKYYVYEIQIIPTNGGDAWTVMKRYRDFYKLHQDYQKTYPSVKALDFPPKKKFGNLVSGQGTYASLCWNK